MNTKIGNSMTTVAIAANLAMAAERSAEAHEIILRGEQNGAIGTLLDLDVLLNDAKALYAAALALHRSK